MGVAVLAVAALVLIARPSELHSMARIEPDQRNAIFQRTRADLAETCQLPAAAREPLHQHCLNQAAFVLLFPECDDTCGRMAQAWLPHAHR